MQFFKALVSSLLVATTMAAYIPSTGSDALLKRDPEGCGSDCGAWCSTQSYSTGKCKGG